MGSKAPVKRNPRQHSGPAGEDPERDEAMRNAGEGNTTADRNYRKATQDFVESERGQREIGKAGQVAAEDAEEIRRAEEEAKAHAKEHDPTEISDRSRPA